MNFREVIGYLDGGGQEGEERVQSITKHNQHLTRESYESEEGHINIYILFIIYFNHM